MNLIPPQNTTPSAKTFDPLLDCLDCVAAAHGISISHQAILAGLPVDPSGRLSPDLLLRAAQRTGLRGTVVKRKLENIPRAVLPAILLLKGEKAGVLIPVSGADGLSAVQFLLAHPDGEMTQAPADLLKRDYSGYAILLSPLEKIGSIKADESLATRAKDPSKWFWQTLWRFRTDYLRILPASLLVNAFALALPTFSMLVYDRVVPNNALETLFVLASGVTLIFVFEFVLRLMRGRFIERGGRELDMVLASELFAQILAIQMKARPASSGTLAAQSRTYETLRDFFISATLLALVDVPFALLMIGVVFMIGGAIGWILVAAVVVVLVVEALIQAPLKKSVSESSVSGIERMAFMGEIINAIESVKAVNAEGALQHRFEHMVATSSRKNGSSHWYSLLGSSTTKALINLTSVGVVVMAAFQIQDHTMTMGGMIACTMLASRCMTPLAMVAGLMTRFQQTLDSLRNLNGIMAMPRETVTGQKFIQCRPAHLNYHLDKVCISYPGQLVPALREVSLEIKEGERIAILGRMGSGKSTLLRVLAKLYEPTAGQVLLDGIDLNQYHPAVVRNEVGYLPQDGSLLHGSIRDNIALGIEQVRDEQIMEAVHMAGLDDFVAANPQGLNAPVGERGCLLSGGQRHAVILARTLLRRPKMLILDEPASNMDMQAEQQFLNSLNAYLQADSRRSLVVASHKTSTLALVKRIVILHDGRVYSDGSVGSVMKDLTRNSQHPRTTQDRSSPPPTHPEGNSPQQHLNHECNHQIAPAC